MPTLAAATAALILLTGQPTPPPALIGGGSLGGSHAREWSVSRPSRGIHAGVVRAAATVPSRWRPWAACVLKRESGATLERPQSGVSALNPSSAAGRWQFHPESQWRHGLPYMVADRLVDHGMPHALARTVRQQLQRIPINRWPGVLQDVGALEVLARGGVHHWDGPGCHHLLPAGAR
jgi:hypothetical protein